jgi:hypothetical protein
MGPKGNPPPGLSFFWGCMALLAVKVKIVTAPLACNMQLLVARGWRRIEVKTTEAHSVEAPLE